MSGSGKHTERDRSQDSFPLLVFDLFIKSPNDVHDMQNIMNNLKVRTFDGLSKLTGIST
jgi:hypothetical protein